MEINAPTSYRRANGNSDYTKSEFSIQIGYEKANEEKPEPDRVTLPQPLFLDNMKPNTISGEGEFQELLCCGNDLLEDILDKARAKLAPGECKELPLKVWVYRKKTSQVENHQKVKVDLGW